MNTSSTSTCTTSDQVRLHVERAGSGTPILLIHEFAGDHRSWHMQVRALARRHECVVYAARGYPPSDVPSDPSAYDQFRAVADAVEVMDHVGHERAHVVGHSMGGFAALHLARLHPDRCRSVTISGVGYGARADLQAGFRTECEAVAIRFETEGAAAVAPTYGRGPSRVQFETKDPLGHAEFLRRLGSHDSLGAALTMRGVQASRPSVYDFQEEWEAMEVPFLIITGDEDDQCLEPSLMLKRHSPTARLAVIPGGHTLPLEEPAQFASLLTDFLGSVDAGTWTPRDPRTQAGGAMGMACHELVKIQTCHSTDV